CSQNQILKDFIVKICYQPVSIRPPQRSQVQYTAMNLWNSHTFLSQALDEQQQHSASGTAGAAQAYHSAYQHQQPGQAAVYPASSEAQAVIQQPVEPSLSSSIHQQQDAEAAYHSLLGMAESFRLAGNIRMTLHCLQAVLQIRLPELIIARTKVQIGRLLMQHTTRAGAERAAAAAAAHLEAAWSLRALVQSQDPVVCLEAADLLVDCWLTADPMAVGLAGQRVTPLLEEALAASHGLPEWHCRFLLKLAQHLSQSDPGRACELLALGSQYAQQHRSEYTRGLFLLAKCLLLLATRQLAEVHNSLTVTSKVIEAMQQGGRKQEALKIFSLIIQVMNHLVAGQAKQARPTLRQLQKAIQAFSAMQDDPAPAQSAHSQQPNAASDTMDQFEWLSREHMSVLVYLLTLLHNMQEAYYDKVQRYTEKALTQVEKLKAIEDNSPLLTVLHLCILEQSFQCHLVSGNRVAALEQAATSLRICSANSSLFQRRGPHCHAMLGLYAMTTNCLGAAESQFRRALCLSPRPDLHQFVCLNMGLVMLRQNRLADCKKVLTDSSQQLAAGPARPTGHCLRVAGDWVDGLLAMMLGDFTRAKLCIKESLKLANSENLRRLLTLSLIVLGQAHFATAQYEEVKKVVDAAVQLAEQIPDEAVQLWASTLMRDLHRAEGSPQLETACAQRHSALLTAYQTSIDQAVSAPEHQLIYWLEGAPPDMDSGSQLAAVPPITSGQSAVLQPPLHQSYQQQHFPQVSAPPMPSQAAAPPASMMASSSQYQAYYSAYQPQLSTQQTVLPHPPQSAAHDYSV
uniref:MAU2 chromatid cohesion factor homolog n=2 Tax=Macrostomum lignano TaxID=282301 RepID=A0A1I8GL81_9PLAT